MKGCGLCSHIRQLLARKEQAVSHLRYQVSENLLIVYNLIINCDISKGVFATSLSRSSRLAKTCTRVSLAALCKTNLTLLK